MRKTLLSLLSALILAVPAAGAPAAHADTPPAADAVPTTVFDGVASLEAPQRSSWG